MRNLAYACPTCGSFRIECEFWVDINRDTHNDQSSAEDYYCRACDEHNGCCLVLDRDDDTGEWFEDGCRTRYPSLRAAVRELRELENPRRPDVGTRYSMNPCPVCGRPDDGDCCAPPRRLQTPTDKAHARRLEALAGVAGLPELADCVQVLHGRALTMGRGLLFDGNRDQLRRVVHLLAELLAELHR